MTYTNWHIDKDTHTATAVEPDFEYNSAGMLIKDRDKGISSITANRLGIGGGAQPVACRVCRVPKRSQIRKSTEFIAKEGRK